ncbi:DUF4231 domain-containing protein [Nannocystis sp.]|uniref:DUF4231 domain-containing protein n=1 Tax=Nannocystis sp. TaxID=1962667 RepID=UPI002426B526|nr:DUF4231 domain-containing protein [Nannocystis sp.]MBK7826777.1 DUF4231 domain-containing protein [Nannocystis sp.]MBK9754398.1 DUF4231 domain-containing protein [Nannocystis sp.]
MPFVIGDPPSALRVLRLADARTAGSELQQLGVTTPAPTLALVGGAASLGEAAQAVLRPLFVDGLVPAVAALAGIVVDGGTAVGVMRLIAEARAAAGAQFPLIGVAAAGRVSLGDGDAGHDTVAAEPRHSHLILVPGDRWGDESPWLSEIVGLLAGPAPSLTVCAGGGDITVEDLENSVAAGRAVILIEGSGGTTDAVAAALTTRSADPRLRRLAQAGKFRVVRSRDGAAALRAAIEAELQPGAQAWPGPKPPAPVLGEAGLLAAIAALQLGATQVNYLSARWLDQVRWLDAKAVLCQRRYYRSRRSILVCSALVPVLLAAAEGYAALQIAAGGLSLVVTIAAGWEAFFRYGDRWRHYRAIAERLRREGWLYIERSGPYADYPSHARAHAAFVLNAEQILADDVEQFVSRIAAEPQRGQSTSATPP